MKRSILRIVCASLLMLTALTVTVGIFAAPQEEEEICVCQSVRVAAGQAVEILEADGTTVQTIIPEGGFAQSILLPVGRYFVRSGEYCAEILISDKRISAKSGGWTEGNTLYLTSEPTASVRVEFPSEAAFYTFYLQGADKTHRKTVRGYAGETGVCEFFGLPYGMYALYLGDRKITNVHIDGQTPTVIVLIHP